MAKPNKLSEQEQRMLHQRPLQRIVLKLLIFGIISLVIFGAACVCAETTKTTTLKPQVLKKTITNLSDDNSSINQKIKTNNSELLKNSDRKTLADGTKITQDVAIFNRSFLEEIQKNPEIRLIIFKKGSDSEVESASQKEYNTCSPDEIINFITENPEGAIVYHFNFIPDSSGLTYEHWGYMAYSSEDNMLIGTQPERLCFSEDVCRYFPELITMSVRPYLNLSDNTFKFRIYFENGDPEKDITIVPTCVGNGLYYGYGEEDDISGLFAINIFTERVFYY